MNALDWFSVVAGAVGMVWVGLAVMWALTRPPRRSTRPPSSSRPRGPRTRHHPQYPAAGGDAAGGDGC